MTSTQIAEELEGWRTVASYIEDSQTFYLRNVGQMCRVLTRANRAYLGTLATPHFSVSEIELEVEEIEHDYAAGRRFVESKTVKIPIGSISLFQVIYDRFEEEEEGEGSEQRILDLVDSATGIEEGSQRNGTDA
tara:strand:- start:406 stop:807 length:402 start_codon:yes stop_codon:yes gene_type:complete